MIFPLQQEVEWNIIRQRKQNMIDKNKEAENNRRIDYDYAIGDLVLLTSTNIQRKLDSHKKGPFMIEKIHTNGTVSIRRGAVTQRVNIRRIEPYFVKNA